LAVVRGASAKGVRGAPAAVGAMVVQEMKEIWKEARMRDEGEQTGLLTNGAPTPQLMGKRGGSSSSGSGRPASKKKLPPGDETGQDYFDTGFTLRELGPQAVRLWLGLQVVSLVFQLLLWNEVSGHLWEFEEIISEECAPTRLSHGVCTGPMWNVTSFQDITLSTMPGGGVPSSHEWEFSTFSKPPTFLLVVNPTTAARVAGGKGDPAALPTDFGAHARELKEERWSLQVSRANPPQASPALHRYHMGPDALTFEDQSIEAQHALESSGRVTWRATLTQRGDWQRNVRYAVFVEDASSQLQAMHASAQCSLGRSWKAFNEQHEGTSHRMLSWSKFLLGVFLIVGAGSVYAVHEALNKGSLFGYRFHLVVLAKFFLMDVVQQACIVLYLLGWYEAGGLRCQLCLFHPHHCSSEQAFHLTNLIAIACSLLSSVSNQLLVRPAFKRTYTEDDLCIMYCLRIGTVSVSVLPFTTALCAASRVMMPMPGLLHILAAIPCGIGWLTVGGLVCVPILACCDDCDEGL